MYSLLRAEWLGIDCGTAATRADGKRRYVDDAWWHARRGSVALR